MHERPDAAETIDTAQSSGPIKRNADLTTSARQLFLRSRRFVDHHFVEAVAELAI